MRVDILPLRDVGVLSPPCGMAIFLGLSHTLSLQPRSKPTVWDGDLGATCLKTLHWRGMFRAHRVGWRPPKDGDEVKPPLKEGSKPTAWDGDSWLSLYDNSYVSEEF